MTYSKKYYFFIVPSFIALGMLAYGLVRYFLHADIFAIIIAWGVVLVGSFGMIRETLVKLWHRQFALDYIAIVAITVSLFTQQFIVALVISFMLSTGRTLEQYGMARARRSLTALSNRIPNEVLLWNKGGEYLRVSIATVEVGAEIVVRKGEIIPLDGIVLSESGLTDESSLTGEPYIMDKVQGDTVRSGTVNVGDLLIIRVSKSDADSTYRHIITLVERAQAEKAPLIRLADRYSVVFTIITAIICAVAYFISHDIYRVLAVLVVATPCPLILATPIALFGGMNAAAKRRVLVKKISSLEVLARVTAVIFDKTGTITLGRPMVKNVTVIDRTYSEKDIFAIASAIERNSLHPFAKAIVEAAVRAKAEPLRTDSIQEIVGQGISAVIQGKNYNMMKASGSQHHIALKNEDTIIAHFEFVDQLKDDAGSIIGRLKNLGLGLFIFTGDKEENTLTMLRHLGKIGDYITVRSNCTPEDKKNGVYALKTKGEVTAMIGDGINDAPALALSDVGMVFSNEEQTAASDAADIILLGGDLSDVGFMIETAKRTIRIARQSIGWGIGLSIIAMLFAAAGSIPPVGGAFLQEAIDVAVIFNALRASK